MRRSSRVSLLVLTGLLAGAVIPGRAAFDQQGLAPQGAEPVVTPLVDGLVLEWSAPSPRIQMLESGETDVTLPGFEKTGAPGAWDLPQASVLVALPPEGEPVMEIISEQNAHARLQSLPGRVPPRTAIVDGETIAEPDPQQQASQPAITFAVLGTMRGVRLGRVTFTPLHETERGWQFTREVSVKLRFPAQKWDGELATDPFVDQIRGQVINPGQVQASFPEAGPDAAYSFAEGAAALISIRRAGITVISYSALKSAGFPVETANPAYLHLSRLGVETAMEWEGDSDSVFEPGERLLFYADPRFSRWAEDDVYTLRQEAAPGKRIASRNGSPAGLAPGSAVEHLLVEKNLLYTPDLLAGKIPAGYNGDRWAWDDIRWPIDQTVQYSFDLPSVDPNPTGWLEIWLIGFTLSAAAPDHKAMIAINDKPVGTMEWDGKTASTGSFPIPIKTLHAGENRMTITMPGPAGTAIDGIYLDAFRLAYAHGTESWGNVAILSGNATPRSYAAPLSDTAGLRIYDTTRPEAPQKLTGYNNSGGQVTFGDLGVGSRNYALAAESGLLAPTGIRMARPLMAAAGADYLIITHEAFRPALAPLVALRTGQGMQVAVEDVQAIYDTYSGGRMDPQAIRAYLANTYTRWNPRPMFVLLVGDGTSDPRRYYEASAVTYLPPMLADVDPWAGETAADNRYVTVDGDDLLPDMVIGRLPANTLAQAQSMVNKIVRYEQAPVPGLWNSDLALVADKADGSLQFAALAEKISARMPGTAITHRLYFKPVGVTEAQKEAERVQMREAILDQWNAGATVMIYAGHGSVHQWGEDILIHLSQTPTLVNANRLPLLVELTCLTGAFQVPGFETLDEALLRLPDGGVAAAWGATGLGVATGHEALASALVTQLYSTDPGRLGEAIMVAKLNLAQTYPNAIDLVDTYTLLGDPASIIATQAHERQNQYIPFIHR